MRKILFFILFGVFLCLSVPGFAAQEPVCAVYISGIGCGNCAVTDPILFTEFTESYPDFIIFEYEIYQNHQENQDIKSRYFQTYFPAGRAGVPFLAFHKNKFFVGRSKVAQADGYLDQITENKFPLPDGSAKSFFDLDIAALPGKVNIWTKNRVLVSGTRADNSALRQVLIKENIADALKGIDYRAVEALNIPVSGSHIPFEHAVLIGDWRLQWNGEGVQAIENKQKMMQSLMLWMLISLILLAFALTLFRVEKTSKGAKIRFDMKKRARDIIIVGVSFFALIIFFVAAKNVSPDFLEQTGYRLPLSLFTFFIALVDGFNPCNMFVLTCLLAILIATSSTRIRLYIVALSFIATVYVFYFLFMAAWLNVFNYISFVRPLRIAIALMALIGGAINCKELFFFKKGISLTISDKHKGPLMRKIDALKEVIEKGSLPILISSSVALASLASLVELPCTAGFPIIYTGILSGKGMENTVAYYGYLMYYNLIYVLPLVVIVSVLIYTFRARQITQRHMEIIKFVGGIIMLLLGIVLLVNPSLLGLGVR